jgi:hypothetical protein
VRVRIHSPHPRAVLVLAPPPQPALASPSPSLLALVLVLEHGLRAAVIRARVREECRGRVTVGAYVVRAPSSGMPTCLARRVQRIRVAGGRGTSSSVHPLA